MIYTLTTNPAIDMNFRTAASERGVVNRISNPIYSPNGKGLNVSFVLQHFSISSVVMGFFGGFTGEYIVSSVKARNLSILPVWVEETTRINTFFNDGAGEYKYVAPGATVKREKQLLLLDMIRESRDMSHLVISGSLPPGIAESFYEEVMDVCQKKGIEVILDISSGRLKELLTYQPLLIKPNDEEIAGIFGMETGTEDQCVKAIDYLRKQGAKNVLLTLGERGAYFGSEDAVYYASAKKVELVSSACAGDSSLAAFLSEWLFEGTVEKALIKAAATGASVAESDGIGTLQAVEHYMNDICVRKVR